MRSAQGDYLQAFMIAGATRIVAAVLSLMIGRRPVQPALATALSTPSAPRHQRTG